MELVRLAIYRGLKTEPYPESPVVLPSWSSKENVDYIPESMSWKDYALWFRRKHCPNCGKFKEIAEILKQALGITQDDINQGICITRAHPINILDLRDQILHDIENIRNEIMSDVATSHHYESLSEPEEIINVGALMTFSGSDNVFS